MKQACRECARRRKNGKSLSDIPPLSFVFVFTLLLSLLNPFAAAQGSPPDAYEGPPYNDDASTTTLNYLTVDVGQDHTLHSQSDRDWGIAVARGPDDRENPFELSFSNLVIPPGSFLRIDLYQDGLTSDSLTVYLPSDPPTVPIRAQGLRFIYFSVSPIGPVTPGMSYTIKLRETSGANLPLASALGSTKGRIEWETVGLGAAGSLRLHLIGHDFLVGTPTGFNLWRSLVDLSTGFPGPFAKINPTLIPIPATPGPCPGGCVTYDDSGLTPSSIYLYRVDLVYADNSTEVWGGRDVALFTPPAGTVVESAPSGWMLH
ncbi:MAG: hypothetical protein V2A74_04850 [bacterium]